MAGLGYAPGEAAGINATQKASDAADTSLAQALRLYLGVSF